MYLKKSCLSIFVSCFTCAWLWPEENHHVSVKRFSHSIVHSYQLMVELMFLFLLECHFLTEGLSAYDRCILIDIYLLDNLKCKQKYKIRNLKCNKRFTILTIQNAPEGLQRLASSQENTRNAQNSPLSFVWWWLVVMQDLCHIFWELDKDYLLCLNTPW